MHRSRVFAVLLVVAACQSEEAPGPDPIEPDPDPDPVEPNQPPELDDAVLQIAEDQAGTLQLAVRDSGPVQLQIMTPPGSGQATLDADRLTYTPAANFHGEDQLAVIASDGELTSRVATIRIEVAAVNDPPTLGELTLITSSGLLTAGALAATDVDGDPLTFSIVRPPDNGTVTLDGDGDGGFRFASTRDFVGEDAFTISVTDQVASLERVVPVVVAPASFGALWRSLRATDRAFRRDVPCKPFAFRIEHAAARLVVRDHAYDCGDDIATSRGGTPLLAFDIAGDGTTLLVGGAPAGTITPSGFDGTFPLSFGGTVFPVRVTMAPSATDPGGYDMTWSGFLIDLHQAVVTR